MSRPKLLEVLDAQRVAMGMSRAELAEGMEKESGEGYTKEQVDKIMTACSMPRVETLFLIMKVLKMACWPWEWCRSKKGGGNDE